MRREAAESPKVTVPRREDFRQPPGSSLDLRNYLLFFFFCHTRPTLTLLLIVFIHPLSMLCIRHTFHPSGMLL